MTAKVIYCALYNEICKREYCLKHHGICGAGACGKEWVSKKEAGKLIADKKAVEHLKEIRRAISLIESENKIVASMGYKLEKL